MGRGASLARSRRRRLPQLSNQENDMTAAILAKQKMSEAEWETRCNLAALYRIFHRLRMTDFIYTHLSARVPGEDGHFLINRYGEMFDEITASRSEEHTSELQSLMRISYAVFCLKKKTPN